MQGCSLGPSCLCSADGFQLGHSSLACLVPASRLAPLFTAVWWGHVSSDTLSFPQLFPLPGSSHARWDHPAIFYLELIHCYKRQFCKVHASHKSQALTTHLSFSLFLLYWKFPFNLWQKTFSYSPEKIRRSTLECP